MGDKSKFHTVTQIQLPVQFEVIGSIMASKRVNKFYQKNNKTETCSTVFLLVNI